MDLMREYADKAFDLAIVDPPYGGDFKGPCGRFERYGGLDSANRNPPTVSYFAELWRVSRRAIVWGGNYFGLPPCKCFIIWDKKQPQTASYAQAEYAWTNLDGTAKIYEQRVIGADDNRIHPTQKPVRLYEWLLSQFAKPGDRILDTHLGSGSIAIACHYAGHPLTACEIDRDYYDAALQRIKRETAQMTLLDTPNPTLHPPGRSAAEPR